MRDRPLHSAENCFQKSPNGPRTGFHSFISQKQEMLDSSTSRLQRARHQYENLLIHAGEIIKDDTGIPTSPPKRGQSMSRGPSDTPHNVQRDVHWSPQPLFPGNQQSETDIIIALQEEIDRLEQRLQTVVGSAQLTVHDAQISQVSYALNTLTIRIGLSSITGAIAQYFL